ncbi:MAG: hypothetical protein OS130_09775 [Thermodesulfobacteriota bacterium]|jgi:hypothetical protein|nr:MAG: hypothetical protein OS130_09775 [Thermodesulfobacteriota bacterium]
MTKAQRDIARKIRVLQYAQDGMLVVGLVIVLVYKKNRRKKPLKIRSLPICGVPFKSIAAIHPTR